MGDMQSRWRSRMAAAAIAALLAGPAAMAADPPAVAPRRLRVAVAPIETVAWWGAEAPAGPIIDIWNDLAARLNLATEYVKVDTFHDLLGSIDADKADVALGPIAITEERERLLDLTHPIYHSGMRIAVRERHETGLAGALGSLLTPELLWLAGLAVALAILSGHLLWWFERRHNSHSFPGEYPRGVGEALWWITSMVVTQGCDDKHVDSWLGRVIAFAWMVGGIVLVAAFTSTLTATLTVERVTGVIHGPRDLAGRTVAVQQDSVAEQSVRTRGGVPQAYPTIREAFDALGLGMADAVVAENSQITSLAEGDDRSGFRLVGPMFDSFDYGIGLPTGSPLREALNTAILRMREDGTYDRIKDAWFSRHD